MARKSTTQTKYKIVTNGVSIETNSPSFVENIKIGSEIYEISDKEVFIGIITEEFVISTTRAFGEKIYQSINRSNVVNYKFFSSKTNPYVPIKYPNLPQHYSAIINYKEYYRYVKTINLRPYMPYIDFSDTPETFLINFLKSRCVTLNDYLEELLLIWRKNVDELIRLDEEAKKTDHNKFLIEFDIYKKYKTSLKRDLISSIIGLPICLFVYVSPLLPSFFLLMLEKLNLIMYSNEEGEAILLVVLLGSVLSPFFWFYIGAFLHEILMNKFIGREPIKPTDSRCDCPLCGEGEKWLRNN